MRSYKDSLAYQRSQRSKPDGTPVFPLPFANSARPSNRPQLCEMERRRRAAGEVS
jgi:hypothetical protein